MLQNPINSQVYISFQGPINRNFLLNPGKNIVYLSPGRYDYKYKACGVEFSGKINTKATNSLRIKPCKTTNIVIKNFTLKEAPGTALTLRLKGASNYYFVLTQPQERLTVPQGTYEYTLRGCRTVISSGKIKFDTPQYRWSIHCPP